MVRVLEIIVILSLKVKSCMLLGPRPGGVGLPYKSDGGGSRKF